MSDQKQPTCGSGRHTPDSRLNCSVCGMTNEQLIDEKLSAMARSPRCELPKSVQVGYKRYRVTTEEEARTRYASESSKINAWDIGGSADHCRGIIHVGTGDPGFAGEWSPDYIANTLLHEVLHAIWKQGCSADPALGDGPTEERAICLLTPLLLDTLRRNPELVAYLTTQDGQP